MDDMFSAHKWKPPGSLSLSQTDAVSLNLDIDAPDEPSGVDPGGTPVAADPDILLVSIL